MASTSYIIFVLCVTFIPFAFAECGCLSYQHCCGSCNNRYCCSDPWKILNEDSCRYSFIWPSEVPLSEQTWENRGSDIVTIVISIVSSVVIIIIIIIISCCVCPCCCLYKICQNGYPPAQAPYSQAVYSPRQMAYPLQPPTQPGYPPQPDQSVAQPAYNPAFVEPPKTGY